MSSAAGAAIADVSELVTTRTAVGEVLGPAGGLLEIADDVAARQAAPATRRTYASVYRGFLAWLGPRARPAGG